MSDTPRTEEAVRRQGDPDAPTPTVEQLCYKLERELGTWKELAQNAERELVVRRNVMEAIAATCREHPGEITDFILGLCSEELSELLSGSAS